ncbi:hypothetical protein [Collinsella ihumii]|uniref:NusG-like N-terminal domain-containing protein n=1 Tax=Collinsella ihumii TaxID=1720204 RepID=A0ABT7XH38_9ACTN|nr:hypothetical protein [Collinsella ihumii]MDN0064734.1 hypothetical protein [Collinsella ihumii]
MPVATVPSARSGARGGSLATGLPMGRRSPRGRERWYLLRMPEGREASICAELKRLLSASVLTDAFVLRKERWMKRGGVWFLEPVNMYRGYAFAVSPDAAGLAKAIAGLTLPVELVGTDVRSWAPLADEAAAWYAAAMDSSHVIRSSTAVITDGVLHVQSGPLVGQEARISKVDRHRRRCQVLVGEGDSAFTEQAPIDVPFKS